MRGCAFAIVLSALLWTLIAGVLEEWQAVIESEDG
jgi:hypothetical protein